MFQSLLLKSKESKKKKKKGRFCRINIFISRNVFCFLFTDVTEMEKFRSALLLLAVLTSASSKLTSDCRSFFFIYSLILTKLKGNLAFMCVTLPPPFHTSRGPRDHIYESGTDGHSEASRRFQINKVLLEMVS